MASIFSQDNPFNDFMSTVGDMAMISIAWTICSIPVVTVGASTAAACEVARELQSGSCKGIFRSFWAAFKRRFPTTLALTAVIAAFCGLALFDLWYLSRQSTDTVAVLYGVTIVVIAVVGSALAFVLPLTGRSKLSVGEQLTQSARLALGKPHIAFAALLLNIWPIIVVLIAPEQTLMLVPLLWIFVGAGASFWVQMNLMRRFRFIVPRHRAINAQSPRVHRPAGAGPVDSRARRSYGSSMIWPTFSPSMSLSISRAAVLPVSTTLRPMAVRFG